MRSVFASLWALFLGLSLLVLGNGLQGTLLGVRASLAGFGTGVTGMVLACYYFGFLAGSWLAPRMIRRVGHIRVFAAMASLVSLAPLAHALWSNPVAWAALRFLAGLGMVCVYVVVESWLNGEADNANRGRLLAMYLIVCQVSQAGGQLLLGLADPGGFELFIFISVVCSLAVVPLTLTRHRAPRFEESVKVPFRVLARRIPLAMAGVLVVSLSYGAFYAMGSVYGLAIGLAPGQIGGFMAATMAGSIVLQWPLGMLSDRMDRRRLILRLCFGVIVAAALLAVLPAGMPVLLYVVMFVYGGLSFPLYSLLVAQGADSLSGDEYVAACSRVLLLNGLGSAVGPILVSALMEGMGTVVYPLFIALVHAGLALLVWHHIRTTGAEPTQHPPHFRPVMPQGSVVASEMAGQS